MESTAFAIGFFDVRAGLARMGRLLFLGFQVDIDTECGGARALLGLDCVPVEFGLVSQHAHRCIDVARISVADAALQLQEHVFAAGRVFLAEYLGINCCCRSIAL